MAISRKIYSYRQGDILEIEENHAGRYGSPGIGRKKKKELTPEQVAAVNRRNKMKKARRLLLAYFTEKDYFLTLTYRVDARPPDMEQAKRDFAKAMRKVREEYRKRGEELRWIRNIERGTKGAWHVHLVINAIKETGEILEKVWQHGGIYMESLKKNKYYEEDCSQLASYITKSEKVGKKKEDGSREKPRISESSYSTSRNMPLPEPKKEKRIRWKKTLKPKKGYYIAKIYEGINPVTGYKYRYCIMIRLNRKI